MSNQIQITDDMKLNSPIIGEENPWLAEFVFVFNKMSPHLASATVKFLSSTVVPKVRASISSVPVAYTLPALTRAAHCASASPGA